MKLQKYICNRCKKEECMDRDKIPEGWTLIRYVKRQGYSSYDIHNVILHFCPDCEKKLKIKDFHEKKLPEQAESVGDRLLEIITEIAAQANEV